MAEGPAPAPNAPRSPPWHFSTQTRRRRREPNPSGALGLPGQCEPPAPSQQGPPRMHAGLSNREVRARVPTAIALKSAGGLTRAIALLAHIHLPHWTSLNIFLQFRRHLMHPTRPDRDSSLHLHSVPTKRWRISNACSSLLQHTPHFTLCSVDHLLIRTLNQQIQFSLPRWRVAA